ncbi:hypothetical protein L2K20_26225 [Mycobacterium sp. MBM]|nr:hypothetical protein [Mycobacterium sp. MBM]
MTQAQSLRGSPAAAIPLPHISFRQWRDRVAAYFAGVRAARRKPRHRAVQREDFIEDAAMAREMFRL